MSLNISSSSTCNYHIISVPCFRNKLSIYPGLHGFYKFQYLFVGRKSACTITINKGGFSLQKVQICEGQVVSFEWDDTEGSGYNITQVRHIIDCEKDFWDNKLSICFIYLRR